MAKVIGGFMLGTSHGLTFYMMEGQLYVRMKSSLSRRRVKYSAQFARTMQHARELARASKIASRVYRELSAVQRKMVYVLYKKMTGVAKRVLAGGGDNVAAEVAVRRYLVEMGVVSEKKRAASRKVQKRRAPRLFVVPVDSSRTERKRLRRKMFANGVEDCHWRFHQWLLVT